MSGSQEQGWVALVGAGPGDEGLLTVRAAELLGQAGLVVAGAELERAARRYMSQDATLADPAEGAGSARALVQAARGGQLAVRLFPGDPLLNGASADAAACAKAGVRFEIVPGVPTATAVPAYAGIPLASERNGELRIIHAAEASRLAYSPGTLVVLGADTAPADLGKMLIAAGWPDSTRFAITWDGTTSAQQTVASTLGRIGPDLKAAGVSLANTRGPAVAVVGEAVTARDQLSWFETKPLFGWRVLVPRTKEQAAVVSQRLREYGAVPEEVPTIAVEPPRTPQQMERAVKGLVTGRYQWVAFTSANAVRAVRERFEEYGLDARAFAGVKVAAVGEQTSKALLDFGIRPDLVPDGDQSAEGLAAAWPPYDDLLDPINRVLLPRADIATETLLAAADRPRLGGRGRHRLPHRPRRASARADPRGHQGRRLRRRAVHLVVHGAEPGRHRGQAARGHGDRGDRAADRQDRGRVRAARRRDRAQAVDGGAGRGGGRVRCRPAGRGRPGGRTGPQAERAPPRRAPQAAVGRTDRDR